MTQRRNTVHGHDGVVPFSQPESLEQRPTGHTAPSSPWRALLTAHRLRAAVGEFLLILAGVLTALVVDAWRADRADRQLERTQLAELLEETRANERLVDEALTTFLGTRRRTMHLMLAARGSAPMPPADSLRLWSQMTVPTWTPITGTVRTLIETGQLRLVRNSAVRRAVSTVDGRMSAVERRLQDNDMLRQDAARRRTGRMLAHLHPGVVDEGPPTEQESGTGWWRSVDYPALLRDPEWQAAFATYHLTLNNYIRSLQLMQAPLTELRTLLERELAAR